MGDTEVQLEDGVEITPTGPMYPPHIMGNLTVLIIAQTLGWGLGGVLAILNKIGLPIDFLAKVLGLVYVWVVQSSREGRLIDVLG